MGTKHASLRLPLARTCGLTESEQGGSQTAVKPCCAMSPAMPASLRYQDSLQLSQLKACVWHMSGVARNVQQSGNLSWRQILCHRTCKMISWPLPAPGPVVLTGGGWKKSGTLTSGCPRGMSGRFGQIGNTSSGMLARQQKHPTMCQQDTTICCRVLLCPPCASHLRGRQFDGLSPRSEHRFHGSHLALQQC